MTAEGEAAEAAAASAARATGARAEARRMRELKCIVDVGLYVGNPFVYIRGFVS